MEKGPEFIRSIIPEPETAQTFMDELKLVGEGQMIQKTVSDVLSGVNNLTTANLTDIVRHRGSYKLRQAFEGYAKIQSGVGSGRAGITRADFAMAVENIAKLRDQSDVITDMITQGGAALAALRNQSIDSSAVVAGLAEIGDLIGISNARNFRPSIRAGGNETEKSDIGEALLRMGKHPDIVKRILNTLDINQDGEISLDEIEKGAVDTLTLNKLTSIDANTAKMIQDPDFRRRVIKKVNMPSIYGEDFEARFNQVSLVEQGLSVSNVASNQFNVSF